MEDLIEAVRDLTRVTIALNGNFTSKSEAIRRLDVLGISSGRIATILNMKPGDVSSALSKARKKEKTESG
jgi:DNA-directed RNA polymerase specialized sigma24 family protein